MTLLPRLLLSDVALQRLRSRLDGQALPVSLADAEGGASFDIAFVTRDVTGLSTKHEVLPETARFYEAMRAQAGLRWVQVHSAGVDRPIFAALRERGVLVTTSSGANAAVVAQTALAGVLALARRFPQLMDAQREGRWAPLLGTGLPRDLAGQTAVVVGWGRIGRQIGAWLRMLGLHVVAVRRQAAEIEDGVECVSYDGLSAVLPRTDWLVLACPLTPTTRGLVNASALARLPAGAHVVNVARGEVIDETALIDALQSGGLAGAYLDVFEQEPLALQSPLWSLPNVIVTPHSAGFSDGNEARVDAMFFDNLSRWRSDELLKNLAD